MSENPYKRSSREAKKEDTIIKIGDKSLGGGFAVIAGPCAIETEEQIVETAKAVKASGVDFLRGGAFKPRKSPYTFQGLELAGLEMLKVAKVETGLPIVSEITSTKFLDYFERDIDIIQVGEKNMQNFELLKALGETRKPIILKRGKACKIDEWLLSAEYIMDAGNENVILCERGIRTFETAYRNTLDLTGIPIIKKLSHLPVIVDPSHACGSSEFVPALTKAAKSVGADGVMIEVHCNPSEALCDGEQSLTPAEFDELMREIK
ncbi:3-deoxy-7-phosphoheptulonate synthase [Treponema sp. R6D11]